MENELSQEEILRVSKIESKSKSIGNLYAKGLYLAGHKPRPSIYGESKKDFQELMTELTTLASENKKNK